MKKPTYLFNVVTLSILIILAGCNSKTEEEVIQEAKDIAEKTFESSQTIIPNKELDDLSLYLPRDLEVTDVDDNNIILTNDQQTYIIFNNHLEEPKSELNYHIEQKENALLLDTFQDEEKFSFVQILPESEDGYKIQVGVGGVKITTYATKDKIVHHVEELMKIALSMIT